MARRTNRNGANSSTTSNTIDVNEMLGFLGRMADAQQQQAEAFWAGVIVALDHVAESRDQHPGGISDFRCLHSSTFSGTVGTLEAEQWLMQMDDLLRAVQIPDADKVNVVKIQLTNIARIWWQLVENKPSQPISWEAFTMSFLTRFFPRAARREMEQQFIYLRQAGMTVEEYASVFVRLSRFVPYMVSDDVGRAHRFQQELRFDIQKYLVTSRIETYTKVIDAARDIEQVVNKERRAQSSAPKRPAIQMLGGTSSRNAEKRLVISSQQKDTCTHCQKQGHTIKECWYANNLYLACGSSKHKIGHCPRRWNLGPMPRLPVSQQQQKS